MNMPRILPNLAQLEAFEATARLGGVSRAAEELRLTQSAVSRQILGLEAGLGAPLFVRIRKRLVLTEAGGAYLEEVRTSLAGLEAATEALRSARGRGGVLNLGVLPTFGASWLVPRLGRFQAAYPEIRTRLVTRPEPFDFTFDPLDAAIHFGAPVWPGAATEFLAHEDMAAVAEPDLAARLSSPAEVAAAPLIQTSPRPFAWREWFQAFDAAEPALSPRLHVDTFAMALEAVMAGLGVAVLPIFAVGALVEAGRIGVVLNHRIRSESSYYLAFPEGRRSHYPTSAFRTWIKRELGGDEEGFAAPVVAG
jgi:LysR family glycine cleavage system transcriptional activator